MNWLLSGEYIPFIFHHLVNGINAAVNSGYSGKGRISRFMLHKAAGGCLHPFCHIDDIETQNNLLIKHS